MGSEVIGSVVTVLYSMESAQSGNIGCIVSKDDYD